MFFNANSSVMSDFGEMIQVGRLRFRENQVLAYHKRIQKEGEPDPNGFGVNICVSGVGWIGTQEPTEHLADKCIDLLDKRFKLGGNSSIKLAKEGE